MRTDCPSCGAKSAEPPGRFCPGCGREIPGYVDDDPLIGQTIGGRYTVVSLLAEGGMGKVYLAEQQMGKTRRKVAIKTLLPEAAQSESLGARFSLECSMVAELEHPNTIRFYDWGKTPSGELFIAMEFVSGGSLGTAVRREGKLAPERVDLIFEQICGSLQEAHDKGIVHRDVKPDNILLTKPAGEEDFVKVVDFGIAKREADAVRLTPLGLVLGSPAYMAPEQFTHGEADARSDVYSLAVVAFETLTGKLPFDAAELVDWPVLHRTGKPLAFEATGVTVPESMRRAILRGLSKQPDDRQASMREFFAEFTIGTPRRSSLTSGRPASSRSKGASGSPAARPSPTPLAANYVGEVGTGSAHPIAVPPPPRMPGFVARTDPPGRPAGDVNAGYSNPPPTMRDPVPPTVREPGRRSWWWVVCIVLLIVGGAGFAAMRLLPRSKQVDDAPPKAAPAPAPKPAATLSPEPNHVEPKR